MLYFRQKTAQVCGNFPKINYIGFWSLCQLSVRELPARTPPADSPFQAGSRGGFPFPAFHFRPPGRVPARIHCRKAKKMLLL